MPVTPVPRTLISDVLFWPLQDRHGLTSDTRVHMHTHIHTINNNNIIIINLNKKSGGGGARL